ncbi:VOC family protein [Pedobacter sp. HMF7647]|uniref:VOC family protein n=1 Tax=Hufsiella arboris TaxID=2695275 RepID=A0A7K1YFC7_9SPHI|nr:VOC family protein [Hufsiella arboris]MXV53313.1 VOC family protein [Hufsiella arboris]
MKKTLPALLFMLFAFSLSTFAQYGKLNHVAVYVNNLKKSTTFYKDILKLEQIAEPFHDNKHSWFKVAEHSQLHLIEGAKEITEHQKDSHLCFSVASMDSVITKLHQLQIPFSSWTGEKDKVTIRPDGVKQIYFQDPDNYWIEINDDKY